MTTRTKALTSLAMAAALGATVLTTAPAAAERIENRTSSIGQIIELEAARAAPKASPRQMAAASDGGTTDAFVIGSGRLRGSDWRRTRHGFDGGN